MRRLVSLWLLPVLASCGPSRGAPPEAPPVAPPPETASLDEPLDCPVPLPLEGYGPVILTQEQADQRWMLTETDITKVQSSAAVPVEVCGVPGELVWLMRLVCPDGRGPYPDPDTAHMSRVGNVGEGGRCGTIIDLYEVPCSSGTHEVYMDMYMCSREESGLGFPYLQGLN